MRPWAAILALLAVASVSATPAVSAGITAALPHGARLDIVTAVPGATGTQAVAYDGSKLGVVEMVSGQARLVWSREMRGTITTLQAGEASGVFRGSIGGSSPAVAFAYRVQGTVTRSAVEGHKDGKLRGDDGVKLTPHGFVVRRHDTQHVGGVPYRFVTPYRWNGMMYGSGPTIRRPDLALGAYPPPNGVIHTAPGNISLIRLEVASTEIQRETGLMYRTSLDPDSGMVFVWPSPVRESFWMENTYIPLTVAFLGADGTIQEMDDMAPTTTTMHQPKANYLYAIEVNQGFFAAQGITVGDRVILRLPAPAPSTPAKHL